MNPTENPHDDFSSDFVPPLPRFCASILQPGTVAIVGAGPGDPGLLTLRACQLIAQAQVLVYDRLVSADIVALAPAHCTRHYVGKQKGEHTLKQSEINELLLQKARAGQRVVRLKGGDPFIFGRGGEELAHLLAHGVRCHVVPGITAAAGCLAWAAVPLTHRSLAAGCQFITGHLRDNQKLDLNWEKIAQSDQTLVFYMGLSNAPEISQQLQKAGLSPHTPSVLIVNGTLPSQKIQKMTLADLEHYTLENPQFAPVLIAVGQTAGLFENLTLDFPGQFSPAT